MAKKAKSRDPVATPVAVAEEAPPAPKKPWIDYCPKCKEAGTVGDLRHMPLGNDSKTIGRIVCGRCSAFEMKSNVFKKE